MGQYQYQCFLSAGRFVKLECSSPKAVKTDNKLLFENKSKFLLVHSSSGFKHALKEVLADPAVQARLQDTKAGEEVRSLEQFYKMLKNEPAKAFYGPKHVARAVEAEVRTGSLMAPDS